MKKLTYLEIRQKYLDFMVKNNHSLIPSAPLVPENDPTLLFVNSGMFPLVPNLLGEKHPNGVRITDSQRCLRTIDIDSVGDPIHLTTFEMLGNWSLNDYFKKEAINLTVDFLLNELGFDINNIYGSVFIGDDSAPKDTVSIEVWKEIYKNHGIDANVGKNERIQEFDKSKNWWELEAGGPCGPCSEIFFDTGKDSCGDDCNINCDCGKYIEIGNNVFMEYLKKDGKYSPLGRHNVDFGGGLDRWTTISQGVSSIFETEMYKDITDKVYELSTVKDNVQSVRIIVDHLKAATWVIVDGVVPGRTAQGYILRRIIRRAIRHARKLGIKGLFTKQIADIAITKFSPIYNKLDENRAEILNTIETEEIKFNQTIDKGLREFEKLKQTNDLEKTNLGDFAFKMYETYGFPLELFIEELENNDVKFSKDLLENDFNNNFAKHQDLSRSATKGLFKGGLADTSDMSKKYHTANHLLLASLYNILGKGIFQKGSNITPERLRLDFPLDRKMTPEEIKAVEEMVNKAINDSLPVSFIEMKKEEALKLVKYASFAEKYSDIVKVYTIGDSKNPFSTEICGGPHVQNTNELGHFKIIKEESVSMGVRRIKAVLE